MIYNYGVFMKCFYCKKEASAKIGNAKADILGSLFGKQAWNKSEIYVCRKHYETLKGG